MRAQCDKTHTRRSRSSDAAHRPAQRASAESDEVTFWYGTEPSHVNDCIVVIRRM